MTVARVRLLLAAVLFFGWLGWLAYLAYFKTHPVVVSRSQVMAASRYVVAKVQIEPDTGTLSKQVSVVTDLHPQGGPLTGTIRVTNLGDAEIAGGGTRFEPDTEYLLLLTPVSGGNNQEFKLPIPPGRKRRLPPPDGPWTDGLPYVYRWDNEDVRRQFEAMRPR